MSNLPFEPQWFSKPGDTLAALMAAGSLTDTEVAARGNFDLALVRNLLTGSVDIDDGIALRLADSVGGTSAFWLRRQSNYQASLERMAQSLPKELAMAWLRHFPTRELSYSGWLKQSSNRQEMTKSCLAYFGVTGPEEWKHRYCDTVNDIAFRTSESFLSKAGPLSAWVRRGEIEAATIRTAEWNRERLINSIPELKKLTWRKDPTKFVAELRAVCAEAGIALVFVRPPSGCRASGATRFVTPGRAILIQSFRYLSDDQFWFTFFHEIGHLVIHGKDSTFIETDEAAKSVREAEANAFAANTLIPLTRASELASLKSDKMSIIRFAVSIGVAPGLVVGQMQHSGIIGYNQLNFLKRRYLRDQIDSILA